MSETEILRDFTFYVEDHSKVSATIDELVTSETDCHFCQLGPIVIVYRGWDDKIVAACKAHEEIVREMMERLK